MEETKSIRESNPVMIPVAIVIAGMFIAAAIVYSSGGPVVNNNVDKQLVQAGPTDTTNMVRPVTAEDHIKGSLDAPIKIVEYSDFECPFCKRFHETMNVVMEKYGDSGEVAWVFRQFPLESLHPVKAQAVAEASECAGELGGNDGFWKFTDRYYELTLTNNQTNIEKVIPQIVDEIGLDKAAFQTCFESGKYKDKIAADLANAAETGGGGTPWSIVIAPNGKTFPLNGAQPMAAVEQLIKIAGNEK